MIDKVLVSDFVTPAWFENTRADRVDLKRRIRKPLELGKGGYIGMLEPETGWTQIAAEVRLRRFRVDRRWKRNLGRRSEGGRKSRFLAADAVVRITGQEAGRNDSPLAKSHTTKTGIGWGTLADKNVRPTQSPPCELLPTPADAVFGLFDDDASLSQFGADRVGAGEVTGFTGGVHLFHFGFYFVVG